MLTPTTVTTPVSESKPTRTLRATQSSVCPSQDPPQIPWLRWCFWQGKGRHLAPTSKIWLSKWPLTWSWDPLSQMYARTSDPLHVFAGEPTGGFSPMYPHFQQVSQSFLPSSWTAHCGLVSIMGPSTVTIWNLPQLAAAPYQQTRTGYVQLTFSLS